MTDSSCWYHRTLYPNYRSTIAVVIVASQLSAALRPLSKGSTGSSSGVWASGGD